MNTTNYLKQFDSILGGNNKEYPYDSESYINYVKMNYSRIKRWNKTGKILPEIAETIGTIARPLSWLLITEPWCGDAAHIQPFISKLAELNPKINLVVQNRDAFGSEIDNYLTNGSKSIPMLIVRDADGSDLFIWGPRPSELQEIVMSQKKNPVLSAEEAKLTLQKWYNKDKGKSMQVELNELLKSKIN